ncbi:MAG TPA: mechanosensitive ion channel, partial [Marine Group III euryarchaeote]|nr:mechanosensitive ion channel [Marine Group III euryarchaeote]
MTCLEDFPTKLSPTYECASELANLGPVAALLTLIIGITIIKIILRYLKLAFDKYDYIDQGLENFIYKIVSVALWVLVILTAANEIGINVMGIVAALGIVGLAVAFASQDTMENIIAGIFLIIDRPFREGDRILLPKKIGGIYSSWGDVQEIGLRTTTVRSTDGV